QKPAARPVCHEHIPTGAWLGGGPQLMQQGITAKPHAEKLGRDRVVAKSQGIAPMLEPRPCIGPNLFKAPSERGLLKCRKTYYGKQRQRAAADQNGTRGTDASSPQGQKRKNTN